MPREIKLKPLFIERMNELLGYDAQNYFKALEKIPSKSIRCNLLKTNPEKLKKRLDQKGWKVHYPYEKLKEIMIVASDLDPGELGRSLEHQLGYYYVQEISSMMPILALDPNSEDVVLDLCASPGSKTTHISSKMQNKGTIIANDAALQRIKILSTNLERFGAGNVLTTRRDGGNLCRQFKNQQFYFDKILVDAPCSGEGTLRTMSKTAKMWNINTVKKLSKLQKRLLYFAIKVLKPGGSLVYSTCTHSPEENEEVIDFILEKFPNEIEIEKVELPLKIRPGVLEWKNKTYSKKLNLSCRIYPQDNNTEGFFIAKLKKRKNE